MTGLPFDIVQVILGVPLISAALLAVLPGYRLTARLNMLASLVTLIAALMLFANVLVLIIPKGAERRHR